MLTLQAERMRHKLQKVHIFYVMNVALFILWIMDELAQTGARSEPDGL